MKLGIVGLPNVGKSTLFTATRFAMHRLPIFPEGYFVTITVL